MKTPPLYIQKIKLENIKTFAEGVELQLTRADGTLPQWTLILGDNGIGKSTLLQFIAWMKPAYDGVSLTRSAPLINDEENAVLEHLVHRSLDKKQTAYVRAVFIANQQLNKKLGKSLSSCETKITIGLNSEGKLEVVDPKLQAEKDSVFNREEVAIYAYSASRQLGKLNLNNPKLEDSIPSFIQEKTELYDAEEILHKLNYAALGASSAKEKSKYNSFIDRVKSMLVTLLPDFETIKDIEITPPKVLSHDTAGGVVVNTRHGKKIPFSDFSLGYKTVTAWTIDLAWRLFNQHHTAMANPLLASGIVLIDELDLHLHPVWQQKIMASLSQHFPNIQFIATAHSPLMVQAAADANHAILKFEEGRVQIINEPAGVDGWRVDQILTSEFFGLKSSRGPEYDALQARRTALANQGKRTKKEEEELRRVTAQLAELPTGETPEEIENRKLISELAQRIKNNQVKIEL